MGKANAAKKTTIAEDSAEAFMATLDAKNRFFAATLGMGWRMAVTFLLPLIGGIKLDQRYDTSPSFTLVGFMFAATAASIVVWRSVKDVNAAQAEQDARKAKSARRKVRKV